MFQSPEYRNTLSLKLSEVLEDVGVNEEMVLKRRRAFMLFENIETVAKRSQDDNLTAYCFGSRSEGTTTIGLNSDFDILNLHHGYNVIQDWSEWKQNKKNLLMIQDEDVTPGYCFLQVLRSDEPLFETNIIYANLIRDNKGRILLKNTCLSGLQKGTERHGPANARPGKDGYVSVDIVFAFPCNSWQQSASHLQERHRIGGWPTSEMIGYVVSNGCFVVGASSKISTYPELEWRISTSLGERCFMFNLNITQLHCYVLMKIILKSFLTPQRESALSSFMCKTVVLHCIKNADRTIWRKNNLFTCLTYCLLELLCYIQNENCPHFILPQNNLMAGQFTPVDKRYLLRKISDIIQSDGRCLLRISIDDIGNRLQVKLNTNRAISHGVPTLRDMNEFDSGWLLVNIARHISGNTLRLLHFISNGRIVNIKQCFLTLANYSVHGQRLEQLASRYLLPFLYSTLGSMMVSSDIQQNTAVQYQALKWLSLGLNSDVTSSRLKVASVFYCVGLLDNVEFILRQTESRYNCNIVEHVCGCWDHPMSKNQSAEFNRKCYELNEDSINRITSFCVRFDQKEVNCVPRELQYELKRSTQDDTQHRSFEGKMWMNVAVVDSLPFLYFLQYKTYGHLQRQQDQERALCNLVYITEYGKNLGHRETALNLIGQCMEQENKFNAALLSYMLSLQLRRRNNAAKFHICNLLRKYASRK